ncbi:DUF1343 domain-containing protein [Flavobacterium branchiophilum]|uniref:Probable lipoprotein n=1 Tax=Flavobacterium branchiophilum (strain FL-15) TaxID=1034807 RepID=G2Z607_FLABF|nr:DUF1343 domain-containing protein [Flavobacterium branchiophilum]CCB68768.1 Probable lipoprotein precursor [Flavobacterium branchiophilum FL-15]
MIKINKQNRALGYFSFKIMLLVSVLVSCSNTQKINSQQPFSIESTSKKTTTIRTGADRHDVYLPLLANKKIGVVTNQTGLLTSGSHLVDFLITKNINIQKIFAPEHGFRGTADAGEHILDGKDVKTGLPIVSLYGNNKKPKPEHFKNIDLVVFDIQDVGARFYTYISTLHYLMEACAEQQIPLLVLDRPNPNGSIVDGPILDPAYQSFVGMHPIPVLHGMTIGEYAQMINGEKWLKNGIQCLLTVIACDQYNRNLPYSLVAKPSPNLPNDQAINLYASLCFFEGTNVSVGRGTDKQFQIYGSPFLPKGAYSFVPKPNLGAQDPLHKNIVCYGEDLSNLKKIKQIELRWLTKAYKETANKSVFFNSFFSKIAGTNQLQKQIEAGLSEKDIRNSWKKGIAQFRKMRQPYLLYP